MMPATGQRKTAAAMMQPVTIQTSAPTRSTRRRMAAAPDYEPVPEERIEQPNRDERARHPDQRPQHLASGCRSIQQRWR
jgi:hypothetical protein